MSGANSLEETARALKFVNGYDDRPTWFTVMAACKSGHGDAGLAPFDEWARQSKKFDPVEQERQWKHCRPEGGITLATLFKLAKEGGYQPSTNGNGARKLGQIVATYEYQDEQGKPLFEAVRFDPKAFRQRRKIDGKWVWNLQGVRLVPFRLKELLEAIKAGKLIGVVEGEKDVLSLAARGIVATCNPMGALKWRTDFNSIFVAAIVLILPDKDGPGRNHAHMVARNLVAAGAKEVKVIELDGPGKDVSDWLDQRKDKSNIDVQKEISALYKAAPIYDPANHPELESANKLHLKPRDSATLTPSGEPIPPEFSDNALADELISQLLGTMRFVAKWGKWFEWIGYRWQEEERKRIYTRASKVCRQQAAIAMADGTGEGAKLAKSLASTKTHHAVVTQAGYDARAASGTEEWDADKWAINCHGRYFYTIE